IMVQEMQTLAVVLVLAALAYVLYLWSRRRGTIECPNCGGRVDIYADECPHCGYEKDGLLESEESGTTGATDPESGTAASADTATGEFTCEDCGETFDSEHGLNIHRGMKH
ncbi:MAG: hypothetical protein ABEK12_01130, partial [Candidatus Nanohaloarchaea archaeon]